MFPIHRRTNRSALDITASLVIQAAARFISKERMSSIKLKMIL